MSRRKPEITGREITTYGLSTDGLSDSEREAILSDPEAYDAAFTADMLRQAEQHRAATESIRALRERLRKAS